MIPAELEASSLDLPSADHCRIVVITGTDLRHDRFALRLQAEFPGLVVAWLQLVPASSRTTTTELWRSRLDKVRTLPATLRSVLDGGPHILLSRLGQRLIAKFEREAAASQRIVEQRIFGDEMNS